MGISKNLIMKLFEKIDALTEVEDMLVNNVGPYVLIPDLPNSTTTGDSINSLLMALNSEKGAIHGVVNRTANYVAKTVAGLVSNDDKYNHPLYTYENLILSRTEAMKAMLKYESLSFQYSFQNPADLSVDNIDAKLFIDLRLDVINAFELLIENIQSEIDAY
jgi:hypothetical protein